MDTCLASLADYADICSLLKESGISFRMVPDHIENSLILRSGRTLVGISHMRLIDSCAVSLCLVIRPGFRRMGLGKKLGLAMLEHCRVKNAQRLFVYTEHAPFYFRSLGYKPTETDQIPQDLAQFLLEFRDGVPMQAGHLLEYCANIHEKLPVS